MLSSSQADISWIMLIGITMILSLESNRSTFRASKAILAMAHHWALWLFGSTVLLMLWLCFSPFWIHVAFFHWNQCFSLFQCPTALRATGIQRFWKPSRGLLLGSCYQFHFLHLFCAEGVSLLCAISAAWLSANKWGQTVYKKLVQALPCHPFGSRLECCRIHGSICLSGFSLFLLHFLLWRSFYLVKFPF